MGERFYRRGGNFIFYLATGIFSIFTIYLVYMGCFCWGGGNTAYDETPVLLRGIQMLLATLLLFILFYLFSKAISKIKEKNLLLLSAICAVVMFVLQCVFVVAAKTGIRYDSLKVFDEALALFSQPGIGAEDLEGYFARYSNNYAMTIMTHWIIKVLRAVGVIHADFSNAVLVLQIVNVLFVDTAFIGVWVMLKKYMGTKQATIFLFYMLCNPLSYVWMPFYYTNTCSMMFAVWGTYCLFTALYDKKKVWGLLSGIIYGIGFQLRATVAIAIIASVMVIFIDGKAFVKEKKNNLKVCLIAIGFMIMAFVGTTVIYNAVKERYLTFDETDTEFPMTHWIAMGLSDTGTFSPADEAYTMSYPTAEQKKEATVLLLKERASDLGIVGIGKLYAHKLAITFADGTGGYHSELNISNHYGILWQVVYGVYRDPLLSITQVYYLLSLISGLLVSVFIFNGKLPRKMFFFPLLLLGSYLFQMLWEAGNIYSIGTMYVNGAMVALGISVLSDPQFQVKSTFWNVYKKTIFGAMVALGIVGVGMIIKGIAGTKYTQVSMSVDQFLFQANSYISASDGKKISQTFQTEKDFSTIALQVRNPEGKFNDSVYVVSLYDQAGNLLQEEILLGCNTTDYAFYPMAFTNVSKITEYELRIAKESGNNDLIFLYYDTGHYDVYPEGRMTGLTQGEMADLAFRVYWREEE
ncbi:MAG: glycosyltransferase family 39 protein [Lachnospiraceae bacterium]|nr:glycosyltransferase family 39 protein [Lachnospiraceae bacterium]